MQLPWYSSTVQYLQNIPSALLTLIAGMIAIRLAKGLLIRATALARVEPTFQSMIGSLVSFTGWIFVLAAALNALGLTQISLALGGSIALTAMALATGLNTVTQDLMAGIFLISDEDFRVGYMVEAGGVRGVVEKLTIRKTKIRTEDGKLYVLPNRAVDAATYVVLAAPPATKEAAAVRDVGKE